MKTTKLLICLFFQIYSASYISGQMDIRNDRDIVARGESNPADEPNVEWLDEGNFGFYASDLSVKASAQILRYRIGNKAFNLPIKLILSSPGAGLGDASQNQITINSLIAPTGGLFNALIDDSRVIFPLGEETNLSLSYGVGYKMVNGTVINEPDPVNFSTLYGILGLRFITGAWVGGDAAKNGVFVLQLRCFSTTSVSKYHLNEIETGLEDNLFVGLSGDIALFIDEEIDLRLSLAKCFIDFESEDIKPGYVKFSVDFGLNKK